MGGPERIGDLFGRVDPGAGRDCRWDGWSADEPFGVGVVGGVKDDAALGADGVGGAVVDVGGGVQADDKSTSPRVRSSAREPSVAVLLAQLAERLLRMSDVRRGW